MSAIGIGPVAQRPSRGLTIVPADGVASCVAEGDADAAATTVELGVGLVDEATANELSAAEPGEAASGLAEPAHAVRTRLAVETKTRTIVLLHGTAAVLSS